MQFPHVDAHEGEQIFVALTEASAPLVYTGPMPTVTDIVKSLKVDKAALENTENNHLIRIFHKKPAMALPFSTILKHMKPIQTKPIPKGCVYGISGACIHSGPSSNKLRVVLFCVRNCVYDSNTQCRPWDVKEALGLFDEAAQDRAWAAHKGWSPHKYDDVAMPLYKHMKDFEKSIVSSYEKISSFLKQ